MIGTSAHPESTLAERVLLSLRHGPASALQLCHTIVGLPGAPVAGVVRWLLWQALAPWRLW